MRSSYKFHILSAVPRDKAPPYIAIGLNIENRYVTDCRLKTKNFQARIVFHVDISSQKSFSAQFMKNCRY